MPGLITFEGGEGAGKSTLIESVAKFLTSKSHNVVITREPGGTVVGEKIREVLLHSHESIDVKTELLLFLAARAQHIHEVIVPSLKKGKTVLCDRFTESTIAYQGYGRGMDMDLLHSLCLFAASSVKPDLIFYLDVPPEVGLKRAHFSDHDRFEEETTTFHAQVRSGFLHLAKKNPKMIVIDATKPIEAVYQETIKHLQIEL